MHRPITPRIRSRRILERFRGPVILLALLAAAPPMRADDTRWAVQLAPVYTDLGGHDQHVVTRREGGSATEVHLDIGQAVGYRGDVRYDFDTWSFGGGFFYVTLGQEASARAIGSDAGSEAIFDVVDTSFTSSGPDQVLFYDVLEDTDVNAWVFDLYAQRRLTGDLETGLWAVRFGLRVADFDNDYRAAAGVEGTSGIRFDASSNYSAMPGPLLGISGRLERGRHSFAGFLGLSVVFAEAELSSMRREFDGPFGADPDFVSESSFTVLRDYEIPITDLRLDWSARLGRRLEIGATLQASAWFDVSVPPGVLPSGNAETLHENTLVFYGAGLFLGLDL